MLLSRISCPVRPTGFEILTIVAQLQVDHGQHFRVDERVLSSIFLVSISFKIAGRHSSETEIDQRILLGNEQSLDATL